MTKEEQQALIQFIGTTFGDTKQIDQSITSKSNYLAPTAENIKTVLEQTLGAVQVPHVSSPTYTPQPDPFVPGPQYAPVPELIPMPPNLSTPLNVDKLDQIIERLDKIIELLQKNATADTQ